MRQYKTVKTFAASAPEFSAMWVDYYNHDMADNGRKTKEFNKSITKEEKGEAINKAFAQLLEKKSGYKVSDFNNEFEYAMNPMVKSFADSIMSNMIDMVLPDTLIDSLGYFVDFKFGGFGDSFRWDVKNNALYTVSKAGLRQRTAPAQILRDTTMTLAPVNHNLTIQTSLPEILAGRVSLAENMMKAVRSIESQMRYEAFDAFANVAEGANIPARFVAQNYTEMSLIEIAQAVGAYNGDRKPIIVGTPVALKKVLPTEVATRILLSDDYVTAGYIRQFNGFDVMPLAQVADYTSNDYGVKLPDNRLYLVSPAADKIVKCAVGYTYQHTSDNFDNANLAIEGTINKAWEVGVVTNSVMGMIKLD